MARRFRFTLAALLRLRERAKDARLREFAAAARAAREERLRRERLAGDRGALQDEIVRMYAEKAPFARITDGYREIAWVSGEIVRSGAVQSRLDQAEEEARQRLVVAQRDRKAAELLRDRQKAAHDREEARLEQAALDELAVQARARRLAAEREERGEAGE